MVPANSSITLTGREDGLYYYRARAGDSPFSETVAVTVAHHSLQRALSFFTVGLLLFLILIFIIIQGSRNPDAGSGGSQNAR